MAIELNIPSPLEKINHPIWTKKNIHLYIKRDDLIHPEVSGNKWRKLKYFLLRAQHKKCDKILSFGGAYSNHIAALAALGREENIETIGIIRGEELSAEQNEVLKKAEQNGMQLFFVNRSTYKKRNDANYINELHTQYPNTLIIPEGGLGFDGMMGSAEIADEIEINADYWALPVGTGTTLSGLLWQTNCNVKAYHSFKNIDEQINNVKTLFNYAGLNEQEITHNLSRISWEPTYDLGAFGKITQKASDKITEWSERIDIPFDLMYNGKTWIKLIGDIQNHQYKKNTTIIFLHTGGLESI